jgi:teichuronic acid exporter
MRNSLKEGIALKQKVLSALRWSAGLKLIGQLLTWIITIVVMRKLSPQDYGLMGMAGIAISYLGTIKEIGLGSALIQEKVIDERIIRQIFGLLLIVNFSFFLLCYFLAPLISLFFNEARLVPIIRLLAIQLVIALFAIIPQSLIDRELLFRQRSVVHLMSAIAGSLTTLALALNGWGVWSLVWGSLILNLFRTVGLNLVRPYMRLPHFSFDNMRQAISFGGYVTITHILWLLYSQSDTLIVGKFLGKRLLGFYSVALTLASLPMEKVSGLISQVAFPAFATLQDDTQGAANHFLKAVRVMSLLSFPVLWGISSVAPELVSLLLGKRWDMAIIPLQILSLVIPIRMISNLVSPTLMGLGRPETNMANAITGLLLLPLGFLVGSHWGIVGVSISWATIFPVVFLINLSRATRILKIGILDVFHAMLKPISASLAMYIMVVIIKIFLVEFHPITRLTLPAIAGGAFYCWTVFLLDTHGCREAWRLLRWK